MAVRRLSLTFALSFALLCTVVLGAPRCIAQDDDNNPYSEAHAGNGGDAEGCKDPSEFGRLPTSVILGCHNEDSVEMRMPLPPDAQGQPREKVVRGPYQFREYQIEQAEMRPQAFDNLLQLLPIAGFTVKYSSSPTTITARKDNIWLMVNISDDVYNVAVVETKEEAPAVVKDEAGIVREMGEHARAIIYGIDFSPDGNTIGLTNSTILQEILKYLRDNPAVRIVVESYKVSPNGNPDNDRQVTEHRAAVVVAYLKAQGIAASRLQAKAMGRSKPLTDNDTPLEIQENDRIELVKVGS